MEFVVGTISLSCELNSFSWSCFRSYGVGTIVYGKLYFVLHVQFCGSCMVSTEYSTKQHTYVIAFAVQWRLGVFRE